MGDSDQLITERVRRTHSLDMSGAGYIHQVRTEDPGEFQKKLATSELLHLLSLSEMPTLAILCPLVPIMKGFS